MGNKNLMVAMSIQGSFINRNCWFYSLYKGFDHKNRKLEKSSLIYEHKHIDIKVDLTFST